MQHLAPSVSFDFFVSPFADKPAGSSKAKLFPFGCFLHVIPFWGCVFVKDTHSWEWYRWLQIYSLPIWPSAAWISCGSLSAGPDTELLNHALAKTQFPPFSSSALLHPTHCITNHSPKIWFNTLQTAPYHALPSLVFSNTVFISLFLVPFLRVCHMYLDFNNQEFTQLVSVLIITSTVKHN